MALQGSLTTSAQAEILNALAGAGTLDLPLNNVKVGLFTDDPAEDGSAVSSYEVSESDYSRTNASFEVDSNGDLANSADVVIGAMASGASSITHMGLFKDNTFTQWIVSEQDGGSNMQNVDGVFAAPLLTIPARACQVIESDLTVQSVVPSTNSTWLANVNLTGADLSSFNSATFSDSTGRAMYCLRVRSGPLAGCVFQIAAYDASNFEVYCVNHLPIALWNSKIDIIKKPTLNEFFGTSLDSNDKLPSGLLGGIDSGTADRVKIEDEYSSSMINTYFYQKANGAFNGGEYWREQMNDADAGDLVLPIWTEYAAGNYNAGGSVYPESYASIFLTQATDLYNLTSQVPQTDTLFARLRCIDSSTGNDASFDIPANNTHTFAAGTLKVTLD